MNIKVYTSPTCQPCKELKRFLTTQGIEYEEGDIMEAVELGFRTVPVVHINNKYIAGFNREELMKEINQ